MKLTDEQIKAARAYTQWYIGSPSWASPIIKAMDYPTETLEKLRAEGWEE